MIQAHGMGPAILHRVSIPDPKSHLVHIETVISSEAGPLPEALVLFMAVWTPGSYLVREYARNVETLVADPPARATKVRKNAWRVETGEAMRAVVRYRVYANELTVRTSHVDESHAFLVGASIFLCLEGAGGLGALAGKQIGHGPARSRWHGRATLRHRRLWHRLQSFPKLPS